MLSNSQTNSICIEHNLDAKYAVIDSSNSNLKLLCEECVRIKQNLISTQQVLEYQKQITQQFLQQSQYNSDIWNQIIQNLIQIKTNFEKNIISIRQIIDDLRMQMNDTEGKLKEMDSKLLTKDNLKQIHDDYIKQQTNIQNIIQKQDFLFLQDRSVNDLINKINFDSLNYNLPSNYINSSKTINYQLINKSSEQQKVGCYTIAFNNDASIVVAGCGNQIKVFELQNDKFNQTQLFVGHSQDVSCLKFMKNQSKFVSTELGKEIKIWQQNNIREWINIYSIIKSNIQSYCLTINSNDDKLFVGAGNQQNGLLLIWRLNNRSQDLDQEIECKSSIKNLSLCDSNKKLIITQDQCIQLLYCSQNEWRIIQEIRIDASDCRLSFINNDEFVLKPSRGKYLLFYKEKKNRFEMNYKVEIYDGPESYQLFPINYVDSKNILIVKHSNRVNILSLKQNQEFSLDQSIEFSNDLIVGDASIDGKYLITWDKVSKIYHLRQLDQ